MSSSIDLTRHVILTTEPARRMSSPRSSPQFIQPFMHMLATEAE